MLRSLVGQLAKLRADCQSALYGFPWQPQPPVAFRSRVGQISNLPCFRFAAPTTSKLGHFSTLASFFKTPISTPSSVREASIADSGAHPWCAAFTIL